MQKNSDFLSTDQAASMLNCGRFAVTRLLRLGIIKGVKLSPRVWRIDRSEVERLMTEGYSHE